MQTPAIIFDFGNVLVDWDPRYLYRQFFPDDQTIAQFLEEIHFNDWNLAQDRGRSFSEAVAELCQQYPKYCDLIRAYDTRWEETLGGPIWPSVEILRRLKQQGHTLYALSNWSAEKFALVRPKYDFFNWFQAIVLSGEVHLVKPDPRIFHLLLEKIGLPASDCLLIDDSTANITTARQLGFQTIHFRSAQQLETELIGRGLLVKSLLNPENPPQKIS
jgi:2-haloacid dehalogenase